MLEIENLLCGYGDRIVLKDVTFKINTGEIAGIIGPNGCGKTTLFRAITKILKPKAGRIIFNGKDVSKVSHRELAKEIAVVSQDEIFEGIDVEEYVLLGRIPHREKFRFFDTKKDIDAAVKAMDMTDVSSFGSRPLSELSGGERQRVFIGRALAQEPRILLLDEPTTHLDIGHQVEILELVKKLNRKQGLTVVSILHDLNLASSYCDRLILMNEGRIFKEGTAEEVLTYQCIEKVYKTVVVVERSRITGRPYVFVAPK